MSYLKDTNSLIYLASEVNLLQKWVWLTWPICLLGKETHGSLVNNNRMEKAPATILGVGYRLQGEDHRLEVNSEV